MLKAKKDNKVYGIEETNRKQYLADGYDIYDEDGNIVEYSHLKTIKYSKHLEALAEKDAVIEELQKALAEKDAAGEGTKTPLSRMKVDELKEKAAELGIVLTGDETGPVLVTMIKEVQDK